MATLTLWLGLLGPVDLEDLARRLQFTWTNDPATGRHTVHADRITVIFSPGLDLALVNGLPTNLALPVTIEGGRVKLPPDLAALVERNALPLRPDAAPRPTPRPTAKPEPAPKPERRAQIPPCTVAIDPGHGGVHAENRGRTGLLEKDINLDVARELQRILESWGAKVVMTRSDDSHFSTNVNEDLNERVDRVNRARPDFFVSVHTNHTDNSTTRGYEVWVPLSEDARGRSSRELAELVRGELAGVWGRSEDRGTKDEHNMRVLKNTRCPAVLVELEFLSNPAVERHLASSSVRKKLAEAIAEGARKWMLQRR